MQHCTLYELNQQIKNVLSSQLEPTYWVVAEIGEMRLAQNGHCYLELVEKNDDYLYAKIRATIWCNTYRGLGAWFEKITGQSLRSGMKILTQVEVKFHHLYGLSLNVKDIDAQFTLGERALKRQEVLNQLVEDGVFEMNRSLTLAGVPQRVAVISSPTAAGLGDFMDQLNGNRYGYQFQVDLFKAIMQGNDAEESMVDALHQIYHRWESDEVYDAVIVIRGGGAQVDLDCFDGYSIAAHIAQFPIPVISGIGHERDETVVDLVAHTRLKTPTAVAEFLIDRALAFENELNALRERLVTIAEQELSDQHSRLDRLQASLKLSVVSRTLRQHNLLDQIRGRLRQNTQYQIRNARENISQLRSELEKSTTRLLKEHRQHLNSCSTILNLTDPDTILRRGFSITYAYGKPIQAADNVEPGEEIVTRTADKIYYSRLQQITNNPDA